MDLKKTKHADNESKNRHRSDCENGHSYRIFRLRSIHGSRVNSRSGAKQEDPVGLTNYFRVKTSTAFQSGGGGLISYCSVRSR